MLSPLYFFYLSALSVLSNQIKACIIKVSTAFNLIGQLGQHKNKHRQNIGAWFLCSFIRALQYICKPRFTVIIYDCIFLFLQDFLLFSSLKPCEYFKISFYYKIISFSILLLSILFYHFPHQIL